MKALKKKKKKNFFGLLDSMALGSKAIYSCGNNFELSGNQVRICQANSKWSGAPPVCNRKKVDFTIDPHGRWWSLFSHLTVRTSVPTVQYITKQLSGENSDRYWRNSGSGRVDHWWHTCIVTECFLRRPEIGGYWFLCKSFAGFLLRVFLRYRRTTRIKKIQI